MHACIQVNVNPKGPEAAPLRRRKFTRLRRFSFPEDLLPGSLSLTHRRCGKPTCQRFRRGSSHLVSHLHG
jgi:hypothetical protein